MRFINIVSTYCRKEPEEHFIFMAMLFGEVARKKLCTFPRRGLKGEARHLSSSCNWRKLKKIADEALATEIRDSVRRSVRSLEVITRRIEDGEGALGQLTRDDSELSHALEDLSVASMNFRQVSERLASSRGLLYRLTADPDYADAVATDLRATLGHVRSIAAKIDEGDGSAGRLVNDPAIYDGLSDVVRGVNKGWLVRTILKKKQMKGYESRVDEILATSDSPDEDLVRLLEEILVHGEASAAPAPPPITGPPPRPTAPTSLGR